MLFKCTKTHFKQFETFKVRIVLTLVSKCIRLLHSHFRAFRIVFGAQVISYES